jgi:hypothetical protein
VLKLVDRSKTCGKQRAMKRISLVIAALSAGFGSTAHADVPAGYKGTPFNPATAGGTCMLMPPSPPATAGPYTIPGRLEFENYDMGGIKVGFFTTDHYKFAGNCYRTDDGNNEASLSATSSMKDPYSANGDVWYNTGDPSVDGTLYPNAMTTDIYIAAVRPGDWVNLTVNVMTAGTYQVGSTWASGNGPPGGEGGNGAVELQLSVNGTMMLDWKDVFPNYATTADFHHWKPYPNMGTVTLAAGLQVIKLLSVDPHLNLDYLQFDLLGADGGVVSGGPGSTGSVAASGSAASGSAVSGSTASGSSASGAVASTGSGSGGTSGGSGAPGGGSGTTSPVTSGSTVATGASAGSGGAGSGSVTSAGTGLSGGSGANGSTAGTGGSSSGPGANANSSSGGSKGCAVGATYDSRWSGAAWALGVAALLVARARRLRRPIPLVRS